MGRTHKPASPMPFTVRTALGAVAIAAGALAPLTARPGLVQDGKAGAGDEDKASPGYLLRCWQDGKLILEEELQALLPPTLDMGTARLKALDTDRRAVVVAETRNATCLLRVMRSRVPTRRH